MSKFPVVVDGSTVEIQEFDGENEAIIKIDDRYYHLHRTPEDQWYFMVKIKGTPRSLLGSLQVIRQTVAVVHTIYKSYEKQVQGKKAQAQRDRDKKLHEVAEMLPK